MGNLRAQSIISPRGPDPAGAYPHANRMGSLLFVSGIGPHRRGEAELAGSRFDATGKLIAYDFEAQCLAVFENIRVILEDAGSSWDRIADVMTFLIDLERDFPAYNRLYREHFGAVMPTRTTVQAAALPRRIAIEMKVIATVG